MTIARQKIERIPLLVIVFGVCWLCCAIADEAPYSDQKEWLGAGPIYSYGNYHFPYYNTYYSPYYSYYYPNYEGSPLVYSLSSVYAVGFWDDAKPYNYNEPHCTLPYTNPFTADLKHRRPFEPWWVGAHKDLSKVLDIARYSSSVRIYVNGAWQPL
jgi:hypothetical protein